MPAEPAPSYNRRKNLHLRPEERLSRLGVRQHRQVTTAQLRAAGWSDRVIQHRLEQARLHRTFRGVYSLGGPARTDRELWMAATLTFGAGTFLGASAAAELYGWLRFPLHEIHVVTPTPRRSREGITTHYRTRMRRWRYIDHIPVTSPEQTILDCAATVTSDKLFRRIVRLAQAEKHTTHARLLVLSAGSPGARGVARLRAELEPGPSPTRSANEDDILELLRNSGTILANHNIDGDEVDIYLPDRHTVIEVQSDLHDNPAARAHDAAKQHRLQARGLKVHYVG